MNIGENIIRLRKEKELTQEELANLVHVSPKTVSSWEKNRNLPNIETLILLTDIFNTDINTILGHKKENTKELNTAYRNQSFKKSLSELLAITIVLIIPVLYFIVAIYNGMDIIRIHINNGTIITITELNLLIEYMNSYISGYFFYILIIILFFILYKRNWKIPFTLISILITITLIARFSHFIIYKYYSDFTIATKSIIELLPITILSIIGIIGTIRLWKKHIQNKRTKK